MQDERSGKPVRWTREDLKKKPLMERFNINHDTYMDCWCPECGEGLNEDGKAVFRAINKDGEEGFTRLAPYLNILEQESSVNVDDSDELEDMRCPHCDVSLIDPDQVCKYDNCKMVKFLISVSNSAKLVISLCVLRTCRWYTMSAEDNEQLILGNSNEW